MSAASAWTWGGLLAYAAGYGVTVEVLPSIVRHDGTVGPIEYLERSGGFGTLTHRLPSGWTPARPIGPLVLANVCRQLAIPKPDWPESEWVGNRR